MRLISLELTNFRQYLNAKIDFSVDPNKNVTLITGEMGAGKSTLEQAFRYVLYGISEFGNNELINNKLKNNAQIKDIITAQVRLTFEFKGAHYIITRSQPYMKLSSTSLVSQGAKLTLVEIRNGNVIPHKDEFALKIATQMIPKQLSDYFFIDGEKIEKMSKNMADSSKQDDFARVVKSILGLNYLAKTIDHLKGVERQYNREIDKFGGEKVVQLSIKINKINANIGSINAGIADFEHQKTRYLSEIKQLDEKIQSIPDAEKLQKEFNNRAQLISEKKVNLELAKNSFFATNNINFIFFLGSPLIKNAIDMLRAKGDIDFGIPNLHSKTIEHLLNAETCLCGQKLDENPSAKARLEYLKTIVPPHSTGLAISTYIKDAKFRIESQENVLSMHRNSYKEIRTLINEIDNLEREQSLLNEQIGDISSIVEEKKKYDQYQGQLTGIDVNIKKQVKEIGVLENERNLLQEEKDSLKKVTEASQKIAEYLEYVTFILEQVSNRYNSKEEKVREELENNINHYLKEMYKEGFKVEIAKNYKIRVTVDEAVEGDNIDKSMGQGYVIIFAFISSVIKMAKEKFTSDGDDNYQEYYPLVMDAPLSNIDIGFIPGVCNTLPKIAEQIIIFLNKKDSEIYTRYASNTIGRNYKLTTNGLLETNVTEV
jgi:DNA sulfur modification protein DndD